MGLTDKNLYAYCDNNPVTRVDNNGELWNYVVGVTIGAFIGGALGWITAEKTGQDPLTGALVGAALDASVGAIIASGNTTMISGGVSSVASKAATDAIGATIYGADTGTWEDYAVAFIFGSVGKVIQDGPNYDKTTLDVAIRPAFNQVVKMKTRGKEFDAQKYAYDVVTRGLSSGKTRTVIRANLGGLNLEVDLLKCYTRATMREFYSYILGE